MDFSSASQEYTHMSPRASRRQCLVFPCVSAVTAANRQPITCHDGHHPASALAYASSTKPESEHEWTHAVSHPSSFTAAQLAPEGSGLTLALAGLSNGLVESLAQL
jgi:hypothetical protein